MEYPMRATMWTGGFMKEAVAALEELLASEQERFQRECLDVWLDEDVELPEGRYDLAEFFRDIYTRKCGGDYGVPVLERLAPLTGEDYESIDAQGGWEDGVNAAIHKLRLTFGDEREAGA